jgi:predicted nuclease with TOPRIM domain
MKEGLNKNIKLLKKLNWNSGNEKLNKSNKKTKTSVESLSNRLDQIENRISGLEDMTGKLEHSENDKKKNQEIIYIQGLWDTIKRSQLWIMDIEKEDVQAKDIETYSTH